MIVKARYFAKNGFFEHGFFVVESGFPSLRPSPLYPDPSGAGKGLFPFMEIITAILFNIFGYTLLVARSVPILFSTGCIPVIYLLIKKISNDEIISITTACLVAINPLLVFFGRNYQVINVSLFFMILAIYCLFLWRDNPKFLYLTLFAISFSLSTLSKYNFLIPLAMVSLAFFPYKRLKQKEYYRNFIIPGLILLSIPAWVLYTPIRSESGISTGDISDNVGMINPSGIFSEGFQKAMWSQGYIDDAFTKAGLLFIILGCALFVLAKIRDRKLNLLDKFLMFSIAYFIVYIIIMAGKLSGHVYHFYPVMPFAMLFTAYFITRISNICVHFFRENLSKDALYLVKLGIIVLLLLFLAPGFMEARARMFDTQFPGLDIAGDYVKNHKGQQDRMLHSGHQAYGILWHADLKGSRSNIGGITVDDIKFGEEERNVRWIFIYQWDFGIINGENPVWRYIQENYELKQMGFMKRDNEAVPIYFLFHKGGSFNMSELNEMVMNNEVKHRDYEYTKGIQRVYYINIEE